MTSTRRFARLAIVAVTGCLFPVVGCGGFSDEEAAARCDQEQAARGEQACFTSIEYDQCVAAYVDCGEDVVVGDACPVTYTCPDDSGAGGSEAE